MHGYSTWINGFGLLSWIYVGSNGMIIFIFNYVKSFKYDNFYFDYLWLGDMERQCKDSNTSTPSQPIGSSPMINSMYEFNSQSQPIGSSPVINSVAQDETQTDDVFENDGVK